MGMRPHRRAIVELAAYLLVIFAVLAAVARGQEVVTVDPSGPVVVRRDGTGATARVIVLVPTVAGTVAFEARGGGGSGPTPNPIPVPSPGPTPTPAPEPPRPLPPPSPLPPAIVAAAREYAAIMPTTYRGVAEAIDAGEVATTTEVGRLVQSGRDGAVQRLGVLINEATAPMLADDRVTIADPDAYAAFLRHLADAMEGGAR